MCNRIVNLRGFREILRRFDEDGYSVSATHWSIGRGGYDLSFEIYYDGLPVIGGYTDNTFHIYTPDVFTSSQLEKIKQTIIEEYHMRYEEC